MKIAYIGNPFDSSSLKFPFGIGRYIFSNLEKAGAEVNYAGWDDIPFLPRTYAKKAYYKYLARKNYFRMRDPVFLEKFSGEIEKNLREIDYDVIFSYGTSAFRFLESTKPTAFWADSSFRILHGYYEDYSNLADETYSEADETDSSVLRKCDRAIFTSRWAAEETLKHYVVDEKKVKVALFGPIFPVDWGLKEIRARVEARSRNECRLVFIGGPYWKRKGGDIVLSVAEELKNIGIPVKLRLIGSISEDLAPLPDYVEKFGYINKKEEEGLDLFLDSIGSSHFYLLPTRADCSPHGIAEANALGVPVIASDVGGISSMMENDVSGRMFSVETKSAEIAEYIMSYWKDNRRYEKFALSSFDYYEKNLSWLGNCRKVINILEELI